MGSNVTCNMNIQMMVETKLCQENDNHNFNLLCAGSTSLLHKCEPNINNNETENNNIECLPYQDYKQYHYNRSNLYNCKNSNLSPEFIRNFLCYCGVKSGIIELHEQCLNGNLRF